MEGDQLAVETFTVMDLIEAAREKQISVSVPLPTATILGDTEVICRCVEEDIQSALEREIDRFWLDGPI